MPIRGERNVVHKFTLDLSISRIRLQPDQMNLFLLPGPMGDISRFCRIRRFEGCRSWGADTTAIDEAFTMLMLLVFDVRGTGDDWE